MSVLRQRLCYGGGLLAVVLGVLYADHVCESSLGFTVIAGLFLLLGWWEYARIIALSPRGLRWAGALILVLGLGGGWYLSAGHYGAAAHAAFLIALLCAYPAAAILAAFARAPSRAAMESVALASLGILWLLAPGLSALWLRQAGEGWALLLIVVVKGNDSGAYFAGSALGRRPLSSISPKKTWEGAIGGMLLGVVLAIGVCSWGGALPLTPLLASGIALAAGVAGQAGDLAESYLKRSFAVKDSGAWIPAMGGVLDLLDSLLFAAPVLYLLQVWRG